MPVTAPTSTRATRSRYSSPQLHGTVDGSNGNGSTRANGSTTDAQRAMMARWLEPPVQNKSSFEEAGFQRHGVFEGMAPLGTLPKISSVVKRLSNMTEEKIYHQNDSSHTRNNIKQQQQLLKQRERELRAQEQKGQKEQRELREQEERQLRELREQQEEQEREERERDLQETREKQQREGQEQEMEDDDDDVQTPSRSRKIILKRPSSSRQVKTRAVAVDEMEEDRDEDADTVVRGHGRRRSGQSQAGSYGRRVSTAAEKRAAERRDEVMDTDDDGDADYKPTAATARRLSSNSRARVEVDGIRPAKRPVGRPRSRRSIAADSSRLLEAAEKAVEKEEAKEAKEAKETKEAAQPGKLGCVDEDGDARDGGKDDSKDGSVGDKSAEQIVQVGVNSCVHAEGSDGDIEDYSDDMTEEYDDYDDEDMDGVSDSGILFGRLNRTIQFNVKRPRSDSNATVVNKEVTDRVVELAVDEALSHCRYPTAYALRTLYDEKSSSQSFLAMVEDVFQQTADEETLRRFGQLMHEKKKDGKKGDKGFYYFMPPSAESESTPRQAKTAPYSHLVTMQLPEFGAADTHVSKKVKLADQSADPAAAAVPLFGSSTATPLPVSSEPNSKSTASNSAKSPPSSPRMPKTPRTPRTPRTPKNKTGRTPKAVKMEKVEKTEKMDKADGKTRGRASSGVNSTMTLTPSSKRRLRNRSESDASSLSSLSPPVSLSSPHRSGGVGDNDNDTIDGEATEVEPTKEPEASVHVDSEVKDRSERKQAGRRRSSAASTVAVKAMEKPEKGKLEKEKLEKEKPEKADKTDKKAKGKAAKGKGKPGNAPTSGPGSGRGGRRLGAGRPPKIKREGLVAAAAAAAAARAATKDAGGETTALGGSGTPPQTAGASATPQQRIATRNRSAATAAALISPSTAQAGSNETLSPTYHHTTLPTATTVTTTSSTAPASPAMPAAVNDTVSVRAVTVSKRATAQKSGGDATSQADSSSHGHGNHGSHGSHGGRGTSTGSVAPVVFASKFGSTAEDQQDRWTRLRRESRNITNGIAAVESFARGSSETGEAAEAAAVSSSSAKAAAASASHLQTPQPSHQLRASTATTRSTRSTRKRNYDVMTDELSPVISAAFPRASEEPSSSVAARPQTPIGRQPPATAATSSLHSRAGTPGPKAKKPRVGPRVKTSPMKRKTGTSAGMPRPSGERASPAANGVAVSPDENDDYCAACGGSGELVCCDGCTRSFHINCVDPPLQEDGNLPDEWFCNVCASKRNPAGLVRHHGVLGPLLNLLEAKNASAFHLPAHVRDRFEGVKTGPEGEYEEVVVPAANRSRKRGYEETPDFFRIRDSDGHVVLCHVCHGAAQDDRPIIPCAFCSLWWHIDCLDPPLAQPPVLRNWRCPAHVDDLLTKLPGALGPAHRFRKIKGAQPIKPAYHRGLANNGFVEFNSDDEDGEKSENKTDNSGWNNVCTFGRIHRISAKGVKLDFLEHIRHERKGQLRHARINRRMGYPTRASVGPTVQPAVIDRRAIDEAQAAHNLSALDAHVDRSGELINALLSQADPGIIAMMAQGSALNIETGAALTQDDRAALAAMRTRIDQLLGRAPQKETVTDAVMTDAPGLDKNEDEAVAASDEEAASKSSPGQTHEVMSLMSDNGDSELGEEDPLPVATPLAAAHEESATAGAAVWPAEHHSSDSASGPSSGELLEGKEDTFLCSPEGVDTTTNGPDTTTGSDKTTIHAAPAVATPLTPPLASSDPAGDHDKMETHETAE